MSFLYAVRSYHCDKIHFVRCSTFKKQGCNIEHINIILYGANIVTKTNNFFCAYALAKG